MKKLKKDPFRDFTQLDQETPKRAQTYRVALQNGCLTSSYWDGSAFDQEQVTHWADRPKSALKRN